jgi:adenine deaminase
MAVTSECIAHLDVALGNEPPDLVIRGKASVSGNMGAILLANVVIKGKRIGAVELSESDGAEVLRTDAVGRFMAPGFIDQ